MPSWAAIVPRVLPPRKRRASQVVPSLAGLAQRFAYPVLTHPGNLDPAAARLQENQCRGKARPIAVPTSIDLEKSYFLPGWASPLIEKNE